MKKLEESPVREDRVLRFLCVCRTTARRIQPDSQVILFGSRARGDASVDSDYDLLILTEAPANPALVQRLRDALYDTGLEHGAVPSDFIYSRRVWHSPAWRETPLHANVEREGVLV